MQLPTTKDAWEAHITQLQEQTNISENDEDAWIEKLAEHVNTTLRVWAQQQLAQEKKIGVLFSGGVDSTLIAFILKKHNIPFVAVTVGFQDNDEQKLPDDILQARHIAQELGLHHEEVLVNFADAKKLFVKTITILGEAHSHAVNVGVGSVEVAGIEHLQKLGVTEVFGGLGSEELFAGYLRHKQAANKHLECWQGLTHMFERDLIREFAIANYYQVTLWALFLKESMITLAMSIPDHYKLNEQENKIILRKAAEQLGLPKEMAWRPKQAAQYGSRTDKALDKLAKKHGFKYKKEFIDYLIHHEC